jgi:hypothetical protein
VQGGRSIGGLGRIAHPPAALAVAVAALAAFGILFAIGRATAGTASGLRTARPIALDGTAPRVPLLGRAAPLPAAPAARVAAAAPLAPQVRPAAGSRLVSGTVAGFRGTAPTNVGCARWAANGGDDGAAGTKRAPFATLGRLVRALKPGQTGCLAPGSTFAENLQIWNAGRPGRPIKLQTQGSPRALLRGSVEVSWRAHDVVLAALRVENTNAGVPAAITVHGTRVSLVRVDVSGTGTTDRPIACIRLERADGAVVDGVDVHTCTRATRTTVYAPGIVVKNAQTVRIRNSFVYHTLGDAIVLGPGTRGARVERTVVDGNEAGVLFDRAQGSVVANSILSYSGAYNVHARGGSGNAVTGSCLWKGYKGQVVGRGIAKRGNRVADPRYRSRPHGVGPGPCFGKRPRSFTNANTNLGAPWPVLRGITVSYGVRGGRAERLDFSGLAPGAALDVRCARGCTGHERVKADGGGRASTALLLGGAGTIELRERRPNWVGAFARVTVGPSVTVHHACLRPVGPQGPVSCGRYVGAR